MGDTAVSRVAVVVPACNEEETVAASVAAVQAAAAALPSHLIVETVVVANGCTDGTVDRALGAGASVVVAPTPNVGSARALGCAWALARVDDIDTVWIATTDADSVVPPGWLRAQLDAAATGADLFLGTVALDTGEADRHAGWLRRYLARGVEPHHGHVHGASLGVSARWYVQVGGFRDLLVHEDVDLVDRLLTAGASPAWVDQVPVTTSSRHSARVVGGVGTDLAASTAGDPHQGESLPARSPVNPAKMEACERRVQQLGATDLRTPGRAAGERPPAAR